jgi:type I restriction enzyme R subunit
LLSLEQIMISSGLEKTDLDWAAKESHGLGLFVRSMVGLDRTAATAALAEFTAGSTLTGNQIRFVELLIDQLTQRGVVDPALIYEEPFTGVAPTGPESLFTGVQVLVLVEVLRRIRESAVAS